MKKIQALRPLTALAVSSLFLCTLVLAACTDEDGQQAVDDLVVAAAVRESPLPEVATTAKYLGPLFQRAV